ncbi:hypothetical protein FJT64_020260 [Amphibalanus amphitrite]|uniref:Uncharacterized protein n=1 Tax=Amphibalanus amphitrite TaxID=1232801 RepID=A0A6A4X2F3_AMPAM|nr:hypothetical protein FJT64_020260 [Amphibalanus amphitrite]
MLSLDSILLGAGDRAKEDQTQSALDQKQTSGLPSAVQRQSTSTTGGQFNNRTNGGLIFTRRRKPSATIFASFLTGSRLPSPFGIGDGSLLSVALELRRAGVLNAGELSLTVCGQIDSVHQPLAAWPDTSRVITCDNCTGAFLADLLRDQAASVHTLLAGDGCTFRPPPGPMEVWARNPVLLLGSRLPCVQLMAETMFQRVADTICLESTGQLRRAVYGRNGLITLGYWSALDGLRLVDTRTARRANGHLMTEGTELRVAYIRLPSGLTNCKPSPSNSSLCSSITYFSPLKLHTKVLVEYSELNFYRYHNVTPLYLDSRDIGVSPRFRRLPMHKGDKQAMQMLIDGKADIVWPFRFIPQAILKFPLSVVDNKALQGISFFAVKRYELELTSLVELFSWHVWLCVLLALPLFAILLPPMVTRLEMSHGFTEAMAMLIGQSTETFQRFRIRYRPFGAVWVLMGMILTTAYLSDLIGQLTMPKITYPRNAKELVEQGYRMTSTAGFQKRLYMNSGSRYTRELGSSLIVQPYKQTRSTMVSQKLGIGADLRACLAQAIRLINETDGSVTMDDIHLSQDSLVNIFIGRIFSKNHPLVDSFSKFILNTGNRGYVSSDAALAEARSVSEEIKRSACRRKSPGCESRFRVKPLELSRVLAPLAILGMGYAVALLALLAELVASRCCRPRPDTASTSDPVQVLTPGGSDGGEGGSSG